jgi:hypothetical protein
VAEQLYGLMGLSHVPIVGTRLRYINYVPFVGLMLVTPGLSIRRRLGSPGLGLALLCVSHLLLNATVLLSPEDLRRLPRAASIVSDALPFLLWVGIAREPIRRVLAHG